MEDEFGVIHYRINLDYTEEFVKAMKDWEKVNSWRGEEEQQKAENELQNLLKYNKIVKGFQVDGDLGLKDYTLWLKVGSIHSEGWLNISESHYKLPPITTISSNGYSVSGIIELREIKGTPFKIKELFNKYHTKSFW